VWGAYVSGTTYFGTGPTWNAGAGAGSDTARGTGAASSELVALNGVLTNKNTMTLRFGSASGNTVSVPASQATLLGTIRTTADGVTEDSFLKRLVSNLNNACRREMLAVDTTDSWAYTTTSFRQANANTANQVVWVHCVAGRSVVLDALSQASTSAGSANFAAGVGISSTTVNSAQRVEKNTAGTAATLSAKSYYNGYPGLGYREGTWLEFGGANMTMYGDAGLGINGAPPLMSGIAGRTEN
jgi:metal-dependent amidase/aminoacylase/carboxypeptidase family protein